MLQVTCKAAAAVLLAYFLFFHGLGDVGLLGPDEPRYASVGREMALTADWVTPRLWGEPWFEKPALVYWMAGLGFTAGLGDELAPRLPVAVLSVSFLAFFGIWLGREFGSRAAWFASAILATSAGWLAFSRICVTDLPLGAAFGASVILLLPWIANGDRRVLLPAGLALGAAVLAKGLVPLVLIAPVAWFGRRRLRDLLVLGSFAILAAAPWYVLCTLENGRPFLEEFFLRHHFGRFYSEELQHVQPFWFYAPVLLAGLIPWSPLIVGLRKRELYADRRIQFLAAVAGFGFLFFSISTNKLPGYLLPLFPALAALFGIALARAERAGVLLACCAALLAVVPLAAEVLPEALRNGLSRASMPSMAWLPLPVVAVLCGLVWWLEKGTRRCWAVALLAVAAAGGVVYLKETAFPALDRDVSARRLWLEAGPAAHTICVEEIHRSWRYGLNYYSMEPLPACSVEDRPLHVRQLPGMPPYVAPR